MAGPDGTKSPSKAAQWLKGWRLGALLAAVVLAFCAYDYIGQVSAEHYAASRVHTPLPSLPGQIKQQKKENTPPPPVRIIIGDLLLEVPEGHLSDREIKHKGPLPNGARAHFGSTFFSIEKTFPFYTQITGHWPRRGFYESDYEVTKKDPKRAPMCEQLNALLKKAGVTLKDLPVQAGFYVYEQVNQFGSVVRWYIQQNLTLKDAMGDALVLQCQGQTCDTNFRVSRYVLTTATNMNSKTLKVDDFEKVLSALKTTAEIYIIKRDVK